MKIPTEFTIHGHTIKVTLVEELDDKEYGNYSSVLEEIKIAKNIREGSELIPLTETQILATFLHELLHVFQWHSGKEYSEEESQTYSGLIIEFLNTRKYE